MAATGIRAEGLSKAYHPWSSPARLMAGLLRGRQDAPGFWALRDVDLSLAPGECLGIVGRNGAGKSTLLQLICGTQRPTRGTVEVAGRLAAMLELGAGFNPSFTGRENVWLSASIHGLSDRQIRERLGDIESFAGIGSFMDRPVEEYSSGMYARLAFAVCAHVDADILIIDEILGVGDAVFQARCRAFLEGFLKRGAVLFVSHDEGAVLSICTRAMWLDGGRLMAEGAPAEVLAQYRKVQGDELPTQAEEPPAAARPLRHGRPALLSAPRSNPVEVAPFRRDAPQHGHGGALIEDTFFADAAGRRLSVVQGGDAVALTITGRALRDIERPIIGFIFRNAAGQNLFGDNTFLQYRRNPRPIAAGQAFRAVLEFQLPFLPRGTYSVAPSIIEGTQQNHVQLHWIEEAVTLTVRQSNVGIGKVGVPMRVTNFVEEAL